MCENNYELTIDKPKVHIFARGKLGKHVLSGMSLPQTNSLAIEYLENETPAQRMLPKVDMAIEIAEQFHPTMTEKTEYQADMMIFIGGTTPHSKGIIQKEEHCYFVHSHEIEDYRLLITTIINMLYSPGLINVDLADIKSVLNEGTYGFIAKSRYQGESSSIRAETVAKEVIAKLKKQSLCLEQAKSCLICITSGMDLAFDEFIQISEIFGEMMGEDTTIVTGCSLDADLEDILIVNTIVMM